VWTVGIEPELPWWIGTLKLEDLPEPLLFYVLFFLLIALPLALVSPRKSADSSAESMIRWNVLGGLLLVVLGMTVIMLWLDIATYGSWEEWFWNRAKIRWTIQASERSVMESVVASVPWRSLFNLLTFVGFYNRANLPRGLPRLLYQWVYPTIAVVLALTTFYRGSILLTLGGFLFVEFVRRRSRAVSGQSDRGGRVECGLKWRGARWRRAVVVGAAVVTMTFVSYGVLRDALGTAAWGGSLEVGAGTSVASLWRQVSQGAGLVGMAWINREYGRDVPLWLVESYLDALTLPVPRALYPSKPERPGLLKITTALGEPESTQSAVTIPGEAFANFGYWGLLLGPVFGMVFALLFRLAGRPGTPEFFLYPGVVFYVIFVGNWMSLTGIMNQLPSLVWGWLLLRAVARRRKHSVVLEHRGWGGYAQIRQT